MLDKDWLFISEDSFCELRVAAVLIKDGRILVQRERDGVEYALPGGHVKIGETLEEGLLREAMEEMGVTLRCTRLLWSEEAFWTWKSRQAHGISFYYLAELCEGSEIPDDGKFTPQLDNRSAVFGWMPVEEIQHVKIYPDFLKQEIHHLDGPMKHFISRG